MKVILHTDVPDLGNIGDMVTVKDGYARNYLIPQGLAVKASTRNVSQLEHQKRMVERHKAKVLLDAESIAKKLENISCTIQVKVGEQDKLYGSVTTKDIEQALSSEGVTISKRQIELEEPIKSVGVYTVPVRLHQDIRGKLKVWVVAK